MTTTVTVEESNGKSSWLGCCIVCRGILLEQGNAVSISSSSSTSSDANASNCKICNGLFHTDTLYQLLKESIQSSLEPYGTLQVGSDDVILPEAPSVSLPSELPLRAYLVMTGEEDKEKSNISLDQFMSKCKEVVKVFTREKCCYRGGGKVDFRKDDGGMNIHILFRSASPSDTPWDLLQLPTPKKVRKRFRGHACTNIIGQGGDPRDNLEKRFESRERANTGGNQMSSPSCSVVLRAISSLNKNTVVLLRKWFITRCDDSSNVCARFDISSAAWRTPFYLGGRYTKARRDVAQTPFFVVEEGKSKRLGVSSVEEQICPVISEQCGGISSFNNFYDDNQRNQIVFGLVKFHASGREDMDVMMIASQGPLTGRPFVCQVIDAFRKPQAANLENSVLKIDDIQQGDSIWVDGIYGKSKGGVGIDSLRYVDASRFSGLQAETEDKVKHYRCLCWSTNKLDKNVLDSMLTKNVPTAIIQATPVRVLHRRSLAKRTRHVLKMNATKKDIGDGNEDHWFTLDCSTTAGTYVKEFVHGDLGRTIPSISSIVGGKVDIVQLDCMGIEM